MTDSIDAAFSALKRHCQAFDGVHLRKLFEEDLGRFDHFSIEHADLVIDYSKNLVSLETMRLLANLARAAGVEAWRTRMFSGEHINLTEDRAVLHTALRNRSGRPVYVDGVDVMPAVSAVLERMRNFARGVRSGTIAAADGGRFTDIVNIGIGGSDLGPAMAVRALSPFADGPRAHFVSNVDGAHIADTLKALDPARTLFLVASKTFTTMETMANARTARDWLQAALGETAVRDHFAAISTSREEVEAFGIDPAHMFGFWDWVGGRFSLWSAIGLSIAIAIGPDRFDAFLAGGADMDEHFLTAPLESNMPVVLAMLGIWYRNLWGFGSQAVIPYDQRLEYFPAYLQQLDMESNGKQVMRDGRAVTRDSAPVIWGEPGTNGQHAFFQLLHQGTSVIPVDFLIAANANEALGDHHVMLMANCLAQSEALMRGRTLAEAEADLATRGCSGDEIRQLAPHKVFPGNRPSTTILYSRLDPFTLGQLVALYEHKIFVQGIVWGLNSFDQWGVELGKELAGELLPMLRDGAPVGERDSSTANLVALIHTLRSRGS